MWASLQHTYKRQKNIYGTEIVEQGLELQSMVSEKGTAKITDDATGPRNDAFIGKTKLRYKDHKVITAEKITIAQTPPND